ncbi:hypothetical protein Rcae01_05459 [Novipirellula caenicola]|uniref:Uncharacterized protein n=1 Tax=Novipirellula caenicola TaxID=1536901 RepID=A0ABP9VXU1_9BACT
MINVRSTSLSERNVFVDAACSTLLSQGFTTPMSLLRLADAIVPQPSYDAERAYKNQNRCQPQSKTVPATEVGAWHRLKRRNWWVAPIFDVKGRRLASEATGRFVSSVLRFALAHAKLAFAVTAATFLELATSASSFAVTTIASVARCNHTAVCRGNSVTTARLIDTFRSIQTACVRSCVGNCIALARLTATRFAAAFATIAAITTSLALAA